MPTTNGLNQTFDEEVPVSQIFLDDYGREPTKGRIENLVQNWDRRFVGVIILSLRPDGRYACLDGWHRKTACEIIEGKKATLRAEVYIDLNYEEEALMWYKLNKERRTPTPFELFNSWREAGDMRALAIDALVTQCGLVLGPHRADGMLSGVSAVLNVYDMDGGGLLRAVLTILKPSFATARARDRYPAPAIEGLALFLLRYPLAERSALIKILGREGPDGMQSLALGFRKEEGTKAAICWGKALRKEYNWKRRSGRLSEWVERVHSPVGREAARARVKHTMTSREEAKWERTRVH